MTGWERGNEMLGALAGVRERGRENLCAFPSVDSLITPWKNRLGEKRTHGCGQKSTGRVEEG